MPGVGEGSPIPPPKEISSSEGRVQKALGGLIHNRRVQVGATFGAGVSVGFALDRFLFKKFEKPPVPQPEKTPAGTERLGAVLGTLRHNRDVQIDVALAAVVAGLWIGSGSSLDGHELLRGVAIAGSTLLVLSRAIVNLQRNTGRIESKGEQKNLVDDRYGLMILKDAWVTGKVQHAQSTVYSMNKGSK